MIEIYSISASQFPLIYDVKKFCLDVVVQIALRWFGFGLIHLIVRSKWESRLSLLLHEAGFILKSGHVRLPRPVTSTEQRSCSSLPLLTRIFISVGLFLEIIEHLLKRGIASSQLIVNFSQYSNRLEVPILMQVEILQLNVVLSATNLVFAQCFEVNPSQWLFATVKTVK